MKNKLLDELEMMLEQVVDRRIRRDPWANPDALRQDTYEKFAWWLTEKFEDETLAHEYEDLPG